jgi:hypothetical protein
MNYFNKISHKFVNKLKRFKPLNNEVIFIVSTGRTGTKFFESFLTNNFPNTFSVHEPNPDFFDIGIKKVREKIRKIDILEYIKKNRVWILEKSKLELKNMYFESNPFNSLILDELKEVFPKAKFILIYRNPKDYVKSALNKSPNSDPNSMMFYADNDGRKRITAKDYLDDKYLHDWDNFNRIEKISWYWSKCNTELLKFENKNKDKTISLKYEDIFNEDILVRKECLIKFINFTNLEQVNLDIENVLNTMTSRENQTKEVLYEGYEMWNENEKQKFHEITNEVKNLLKY